MTLNMVQLGSYVDLVMGQAPPGETCNKEAEGTVFIKAGEFQSRSPAIREWTTQPLKFAKTKDTLVCVVGATAGKVNFATFDCAIGRSVAAVRPKPEKVDALFLFHFLQTTVQILRDRSQGAAQGVITREMLQSLKLVLPSLPEQRRIAAILDQADALRSKRREALAQLDNLTQSLFINMFGNPAHNPMSWPVRTLKDLGNISTGGTPPSGLGGMFGGDIPFITPGDLESGRPAKRTVTTAGALQAGSVRAGSTLVCCIGATIGKIDIAATHSSFNQQLNAVEWFSDTIDDYYGLTALRFFKPTIIAWGASTTLPILKKSSFERVAIPVPPLTLQKNFAQQYQKLEVLRSKNKDYLELADDLFLSLQARAFSGEL